MRFSVTILAALLALQSITPSFATGQPDVSTTMEVLDLVNQHTGRPIKINLWYPKGMCSSAETVRCLAASTVTPRVVVFSHGSMGSANEYSWLLRPLAERGFVVLGISHFGESWLYGRETIDPSSVVRFWQRAQDISEALTQLSKEPLFQIELDWTNVTAVGHSAGGQTAAALAGARFNASNIADYCQSEASKLDLGCAYSRSTPSERNVSPGFLQAFSANYFDPRVRSIVMLDPALGPAVVDESLRAIGLPALVVGASNNDFLPFENHAAHYAKQLRNAELIALANNEGHFVFIDECDHLYEAQGVPLCKDRDGVDRSKTHAQLLGIVLVFLEKQQFQSSEIESGRSIRLLTNGPALTTDYAR
jgi:predicted dienelactone hydrolase